MKQTTIWMTGEDLAEAIGLSKGAVFQYEKSGLFRRDSQTMKFDAFANILAYIKHIRPVTKTGKPGGRPRNFSPLDDQLKEAQVEKLNWQNKERRRGDAQKEVEALVEYLGAATDRFRKSIEGCEQCSEAARKLVDEVSATDVDAVLGLMDFTEPVADDESDAEEADAPAEE